MHVLAELEEVEKKVSVEDGLVVVSMTFYYKNEFVEIGDTHR